LDLSQASPPEAFLMRHVRLTRTFVQNVMYQRLPGSDPNNWQALPAGGTHERPLDQQVAEWVERTGAILVHPGQLGIHTQWHDKDLTLKCITLGLTVLYVMQEVPNDQPGPTEVATPFDEPDAGAQPIGAGGADTGTGANPGASSSYGAIPEPLGGVAATYRHGRPTNPESGTD
jgi:hypothetical protein